MFRIYKTFGGFVELEKPQPKCWIHCIQPTPSEIALLENEFKVLPEIVQDILDIDERPRFETDDDWQLVILRIPVPSPSNGVPYFTAPLGIYITDNFTITLCAVHNEVLPIEQPSIYKEQRQMVTDVINFIFKVFERSSIVYLRYLKQINQQTTIIEKDLEKAVRNQELNHLLKMGKSLVFFVTSLKSNEIVLTKFRNSKKTFITEDNEDMYEDALIENKQALELSKIYSDIQSDRMESFASIISNNTNEVMKKMTSFSIILMIPTLVASIYGMNVPNYLERTTWAFPLIIVLSALLAITGILLFRRRQWF